MVGQTLGAYRIVGELGRGGMGAVYLGVHNLIGRKAAIKLLLPEMSANRVNVERFFNEAKAITAITDPGIVQVYDFGYTDDKTAYLVMELLEGQSLGERLRKRGRLLPRDAVMLVRQVAGSLAATHASGIIHRDLKPENLFIVHDPATGGERVKILDFGIAKLDDDTAPDRSKTRTGAVFGTPTYMSPEQCKSSGDVDARSDIYSLGCVLFHLLVGRPPFDVHGVGALLLAHVSEPAPAPSKAVPTVPPDVDALVLRCMQKRPADRYASMRELADACETVLARVSAVDLAARSGAGVLPTVAADTVPPTPARRRALWIAGMALAVVGGIGIAFAVAGRTPHLAAPASATPAVTPPTPTPTPPAPTPAPPTPPVESAAPTAAVTTPATDPQPMTVVPTAPPTPATTPATTSSTTPPPPKHTATPTKPRPHAPKTTKGSDSEDLYGDR